MRRLSLLCSLIALSSAPRVYAPPPMATADVPTAPKGGFELYVGTRYQESESGAIGRQIPFTELVYGISDRQELTLEVPYLSTDGAHGFGDAIVGTKYIFLKETQRSPGAAVSFELKLPTGSEARGLGSGELDYDIRLRTQKTFGWFTALGNLGYTFITEPEFGGVRQGRENVWFAAFGQEYQIARRTRLLSEIYWVTHEEPGGPHRLACNLGFKHKLREKLTFHGALGKSLRESNAGGPALRVYVGVKWEFGRKKG